MAESGTKVGSIFYESSIDSKGVEKGANEIQGQLGKLKKGFNSLNPTVRALGVSLGAYLGASVIKDFFRDAIVAANESNRVMAQTNAVIASTGGVAGMTSESVRLLAEEIQRTTAVSDDAAQSGMNMLLTFTSIGQSVFPTATRTMLDMATAMNGGVTPSAEALRGTAIQLGKALQDPIQGTVALRRVGVNFTDSQQRMIKSLVETGNKMDAQKYILAELNREFGGSAVAQARTFEGQMQNISNTFNDLYEDIGNALIPAISFLASALKPAAGGFNAVSAAAKVLGSIIIGVITVFRQLGMLIGAIFGGIVGTIKYGISNGIEVFKEGLTDMMVDAAHSQEMLTDVWSDEGDKQTGIFQENMDDQADASGGKTSKVKKDLEDETEKYRDEMAKRKTRFVESLADIVFAHQDKVAELRKDLDEENKDFSRSMADRVRDFKEAMDEMKSDHTDKITELESELAKETEGHAEKTSEIQALIDQELSYGKNARQSKITAWKEELAEEIAAYDEKVLAVQEKIAKENTAYEEQIAKAVARDEEETARLKEQHDIRIADYQTQLDAENAILNAHQAEVNMVKDKAREDDIARLVRQHAEENAEAAKQHTKRMGDIVEAGKSEGAAGGGAFNSAMGAKMDDANKMIDNATKDMSKNLGKNLADGAREGARAFIDNFINGIIANAKKALVWAGKHGLLGPGGLLIEHLKPFQNIDKFAGGVRNFEGGLALVGERGPELVNLPRGSDVYSADETRGMGQNIYVTVERIESRQDMDALVRELGFRINQLP